MADVVADGGAAVVIMHNRDTVDPEVDIEVDMLLWTDREHCADYAASSAMLRGRKSSLGVLTWLQR
jgi:hypothetical protein